MVLNYITYIIIMYINKQFVIDTDVALSDFRLEISAGFRGSGYFLNKSFSSSTCVAAKNKPLESYNVIKGNMVPVEQVDTRE